jgi:glycosyltransferase involved in cell wall biosynthesis
VRFVQSIQTTQPRPAWHWRLQAIVHHAAECIAVPSPSAARVAHERSNIPRDKIVVIPNAIDPGEFERSPEPDPSSKFPIGFIGRLDPVKRVSDLIEAVKPLEAIAHLHIYGDGPERERLRLYGDFTGSFTLHGAVARPQEALGQIGLLVLPSQAEGFGLVLIEAMAAGVPVIGTDVPGIRDVIENEVNGLLVPPASPRELSITIQRVMNDRALRQRLIAGGLRTVRTRYTWDAVLPAYRRLLRI